MTATRNCDIDALFSSHIATVTDRFSKALAAADAERALVFSGPPQYVDRDDQAYPFRPDPYFQQWYPHPAMPEAVIEFMPGTKPRLLVPRISDYWHESTILPDGDWRKQLDCAVLEEAQIAGELRRKDVPTAAVGIAGISIERDGKRDAAFLAHLDYQRACKTTYEVMRMRQASEIAARGHLAVAAAFHDVSSEFTLHQLYCSATSQRESELPYPSIIGINEHAAILHYQNLRRESPRECRSLLIDAGASACGYAADVTRTYAQKDGRFAELIACMNAMQLELCREVAAGIDFVNLNLSAHARLANVLEDQGLLRCSAAVAFELGITRSFLPHGLGHLLGLQVHDAGGRLVDTHGSERAPPTGHPYLRLTRTLEPGFVLTIEPGLYFIPSLLEEMRSKHRGAIDWSAVDTLLPYGGIRIEDNLLVESHGSENLTRHAFATA